MGSTEAYKDEYPDQNQIVIKITAPRWNGNFVVTYETYSKNSNNIYYALHDTSNMLKFYKSTVCTAIYFYLLLIFN